MSVSDVDQALTVAVHVTQEWHLFRLAALHGASDVVCILNTCSHMHTCMRAGSAHCCTVSLTTSLVWHDSREGILRCVMDMTRLSVRLRFECFVTWFGFCRAACACVRACEAFAPVRSSLESSSGSGSHGSQLRSVLSACVPIRNLIFPRERSIVAAVRTLEAHRAREQQNSRNSTVQRFPTFDGLPPWVQAESPLSTEAVLRAGS